MHIRYLLLFFISGICFACGAQERYTIDLTRKVYPSSGYEKSMNNRFYNKKMQWVDKKGHWVDTVFKLSDRYEFIAGDFTDGKTKFSLAFNSKEHTLYIFPYKRDSVDIDAAVNFASVEGDSLITLGAYGKTYGVTLNPDQNSVTVIHLDGTYKHPDARIYDSLMPDVNFTLLNGQKDKFINYTHQHKYVFIMFWNTWQLGDMKDIDELKNISDLYKEALTVLSFHRDTLVVKQIEQEKNIDWIEAKDDRELRGCFPASHGSDGILFTDEGKAIAFNLRPDELKPFIEKLLHVTN